jgi:hypothetical protein
MRPRKGTLRRVGSYYNKLTKSLTDGFYQKIIELENEVQLSSHPSMDTIKELGSLYKKAIEAFSGVSSRKVEFYTNKLTKLLVAANKIAKKQGKKPTKWSQYMDRHKKNTNKFMLFLQIETTKKGANDLIDSKEKLFSEGYKEIQNDLEEQEKRFLELKKKKKIMNVAKLNSINTNKGNAEGRLSNVNEIITKKSTTMDKLRGRNDQVDSSLNDFMRKFHYIYLHSKIFATPIEKLNEILEKVFLHKIDKYYYYQDQIKQFQLMLNDDENDNNEQDEGIDVYVKSLQNERKTYYIVLENLIKDTCEKMQKICEEAQVDEDKNSRKYLDEFMGNISKIFI